MSHDLLEPTVALLDRLVAYPTVSSDSNTEMIADLAMRLEDAGAVTETLLDPSGRKANLFATLGPPGKAIEEAGLLSRQGVRDLFARHDSPQTSESEKVQMDAVINHLLGVQIMHRLFVADDVPARARAEADRLGWRVEPVRQPAGAV